MDSSTGSKLWHYGQAGGVYITGIWIAPLLHYVIIESSMLLMLCLYGQVRDVMALQKSQGYLRYIKMRSSRCKLCHSGVLGKALWMALCEPCYDIIHRCISA